VLIYVSVQHTSYETIANRVVVFVSCASLYVCIIADFNASQSVECADFS